MTYPSHITPPQSSILLTFDVEDWFQVENFKSYIKFSTWDSLEFRAEANIHKILVLLNSFSFKPKATFFILGWIAEKVPNLVRAIHNQGHEVASHGFNHCLGTNLSKRQLIQDLEISKKLLEDLTGSEVAGYRAPSFAINNTILNHIKTAGYKYDSSYNSFSRHERYGEIDLSNTSKKGTAYKFFDTFYEVPVSNLKIKNTTIPLGGGGYFRLLPWSLFRIGINRVLMEQNAFTFYAHPWQFDPGQPKVTKASKWFKFRHYINLNKTEQKLIALVNDFSNCRFMSCSDYIQSLNFEQLS